MFSRTYATASKALKISSTAAEGPLSQLTVKINAGSRYAPKDGLSHLLSRFNFQDTSSKSALRFARETELLGGFYKSSVDRENIVVDAVFQKEDLPYFVNGIANVITSTKYSLNSFNEIVVPAAAHDAASASSDATTAVIEALHAATFFNGLGKPIYYDAVDPATVEDVAAFAEKAYVASNISITGLGVDEADLTKFVGESAFAGLAAGTASSDVEGNSTFFQEYRQRSSAANAAAIGVPVLPAEYALYEAVAAYLNATSPVTAQLYKYSDSALFAVAASGSAHFVSSAIKTVVASLKAGVDVSQYAPLAQTVAAVAGNEFAVPKNLGSFSLKDFSYVAHGNLAVLPYRHQL